MKTLIVLTAVPGAGKSTWADNYQKSHPHTYIVSADSIREEFFGSRKNFSNESFVWATFRKRIHDYAHINDDVTVILDAINAKNEYRQEFVEKTPEFDILHLVYLKKSLAVALAQNALRSKEMIVPPEIIANYFAHIEEPNPLIHDLYTKVEIIN
jgi:predicted kinase